MTRDTFAWRRNRKRAPALPSRGQTGAVPRGAPCARLAAIAGCALILLVLPILIGCEPAGLRTNPDEDIWTIHCCSTAGPEGPAIAARFAAALRQVSGLRADRVQVSEQEEGTAIYYGLYRREYDDRSGIARYQPDPSKDLELIRSLYLSNSRLRPDDPANWPFRLASMQELPDTRSGDPAWDLSNQKGYWSLQVGVFYNTEQMRRRKSAAQEYCRLLREQGEEAYFYHGPDKSSVCIGLFPKDAIKEIRHVDPLTGVPSFWNVIVDERMQELQKKYDHVENGHVMKDVVRNPQTGEKEATPIKPFAVKLPSAPGGSP